MFDVVAGEHALGTGGHRGAGERSGVKGQHGLGRDYLAVVGGAHLDVHVGAGGGAGGLEDLGAAHGRLHWRARLFGQQGRQGLQVDGNLPAKPAADLHGNYLDLGYGQVQHAGQGVAGGEGALGADPDGQFAVGVPECGAVLGLDVALMHR